MFKYAIAAVLLITATPASARDMMISSGRQEVIQEAAKTICRMTMEGKGKASENFDREVSYLRLTPDEHLYMLSLCILYAQGRVDQIRSR